MKHPVYPCLWFDNNSTEAATYYCSVFTDGKILHESPLVSTFEIRGTKFMALNGGPQYHLTPAISYYVYCENEEEVNRLFNALSPGGKTLMSLGKYDWSDHYAWIMDKYGVSWQLDISSINSPQKIVPTLLFANHNMNKTKEAAVHYTNIFSSSASGIILEAPYPESAGMPAGVPLFIQFRLNGTIFNAINSNIPHEFDFSPGNSFVVDCDTQEEIDHYWEKLGKDGRYDMCGWLADKYGVSWQIVPSILPRLMSDPEKGPRVVQAFLKMKKFDIAALLRA